MAHGPKTRHQFQFNKIHVFAIAKSTNLTFLIFVCNSSTTMQEPLLPLIPVMEFFLTILVAVKHHLPQNSQATPSSAVQALLELQIILVHNRVPSILLSCTRIGITFSIPDLMTKYGYPVP